MRAAAGKVLQLPWCDVAQMSNVGAYREKLEAGRVEIVKAVASAAVLIIRAIDPQDVLKGMKGMKDGNAWCCVGAGFENLQESDNYSFGETRAEAIENYGKLMLSASSKEEKK